MSGIITTAGSITTLLLAMFVLVATGVCITIAAGIVIAATVLAVLLFALTLATLGEAAFFHSRRLCRALRRRWTKPAVISATETLPAPIAPGAEISST